MKLAIDVVCTISHLDKLQKVLEIEGVEVDRYKPIYDVVMLDGSTRRCPTFENALAVIESVVGKPEVTK